MKINIDTSKILTQQKALMSRKLDAFTDRILESVNEKTPENTTNLVWNNERSEVIDNNTSLHTRVYNNTEYAPYVEYGVRGEIRKYHKPRWSVMIERKWAWMFWITAFELWDKFNQVTKNVW